MNKEIKKIKAALRNKSVQVTVFDSTRHSKDIPTNEYVLLEDALAAIDEIRVAMEPPPKAKTPCKHRVITNTGDNPSYCIICGETFGAHHKTSNDKDS